ncbi:MAG TPA: ferritin-like domain-containing protein [Chloroflexota bacterium]|nr:ferritin-like domain-containing protein [Chloroflexota bacterium]
MAHVPSEKSSRGGKNEPIWQDRLQKMMQNAEQDLDRGALTAGYKANPDEIIALLKRAQAGEWSSFLQYWHHYFMASDLHSAEIKEHFKKHAKDELEHATMFGQRIQQLGGVPCDKPEEIAHLTTAPTEYNHDLRSMIEADLVGERQTIDFYDEIIRVCGFDDNVTRRLFEHALKEEAEHADDWATLLFAVDASTGQTTDSLHEELIQLARASAQGRQARSA